MHIPLRATLNPDDYHLAGITHQHWVHRCSQRYRCAWDRSPAEFILHHHCLPDQETAAGSTTTTASMVSWKIWTSRQRCLTFVPDTDLFLRVLAFVNARRAELDKLVCGHVLGSRHLLAGVLRYLGKTDLCWTSRDGEERLVMSKVTLGE